VTFIANICLLLLTKVKSLANAKAVFRALILSAFLIGQFGATAHAHDHNHEHAHEHQHEDQKQDNVCTLCIVAVSDDDTSDNILFPETLDGPDCLNLSAIMSAYRIGGSRLDLRLTFHNGRNPRSPKRLLDAPRAPPFN